MNKLDFAVHQMMNQFYVLLSLSFLLVSSVTVAKPIVIAHRGASGYLPEHTLEAKVLAYAMQPDYIEQDVVMTRDDHLIVLHDRYLDRISDVAEKFPDRARRDGRYYAIDFTLAEIKTLRVTEPFARDTKGNKKPIYPHRFPSEKSNFQVSTLSEEIELIQGLNDTLGYDVGLYTEIKAPWFHLHEGKDISWATLNLLKQYGYTKKTDKIYVQCFDPHELERIHDDLMLQLGIDLKLIQLIAHTNWQETMVYNKNQKPIVYDYAWMFSKGAMSKVARYADGIGPWISMVIDPKSTRQKLLIHPILQEAQKAGLKVHPFTFRADPNHIPAYAKDFKDLVSIFHKKLKVDGFFTDFPDQVIQAIQDPSNSITSHD